MLIYAREAWIDVEDMYEDCKYLQNQLNHL